MPDFFCVLYINLPFCLVGLSYAVEFLKDLGGDTRAVVGFNLGRMGWWYPAASGSYCSDNSPKQSVITHTLTSEALTPKTPP